MGTASLKLDKEKGKKRGVSMERSKASAKEKKSPDGLNYIARAYRPTDADTPPKKSSG